MFLAVYAGTFDPLTFGHLDIIQRAAASYGSLVVATTQDTGKQMMFSLEERLELLRGECSGLAGVRVESFSGLLVDYARQAGARLLIRGLRASADFEYEFEMALMNRAIAPDIETVFMVTSPEFMFVSSTMIKAVARVGGDIGPFVPLAVRNAIIRKLAAGRQ
jgi:pantetheine-phosphate adenylyltransferase